MKHKHTRKDLEWHREAHKTLDKLMACFIENTGRMPSQTTVMEFARWNFDLLERAEMVP